MKKAFRVGIPASVVCKTAEKAFLPVRINDPRVRLSDDQQYMAIAGDFLDVEPGVEESTRLKIAKGWPRRVIKRHPRVRLMVDVAADLGNGMRSHTDYASYVTLVR